MPATAVPGRGAQPVERARSNRRPGDCLGPCPAPPAPADTARPDEEDDRARPREGEARLAALDKVPDSRWGPPPGPGDLNNHCQ
eukprot:6039768-Lingulodinium_polyedra.AAC.2